MPKSPPPHKIPFSQRREREFLYLSEVDALIDALEYTRSPTRNQALAILLFCQALQPAELCWLRWRDVDFAEKILRVDRIRSKPDYLQPQTQAPTNIQLLCEAEIDILQQLEEQRTTDWLFASERKQRLSERSLHHIIQQAGAIANLPFPTHPYMLRRSGLYYRAALLLQHLGLTLRQCCLLWNWNGTTVEFSPQSEQDYHAIEQAQVNAFKSALEKLKAFAGIAVYQNVIDYLLGAFLLFPRLQGIPQDYWLAPKSWSL
ncbi:tyrosine-type recombinase/integrase [Chroococcidiopsis sp.]|uniref:tyrosine-type recombinase/integrase n=1 Tax=Chroococcidiopsis sp. TaxID=3088168 RepID=UPI003F3FB62E